MREIQGKSILVRVSARFELASVRVIGSRLYIRHIHRAFIIIFETRHTGLITASLNVFVELLPSSPFRLSPCFFIGFSPLPFYLLFLFPSSQFLGLCSRYVSHFATQVLQVTTCSTFDSVTYIFGVSILCTFSLLFAVFSQLYSLLWLYLFSMLSLLLLSCSRSRDFSLTRESNSLSDYWRVRLLSLEPRLFLYCPHSTTLSFRLQFPSFSISFLWIP